MIDDRSPKNGGEVRGKKESFSTKEKLAPQRIFSQVGGVHLSKKSSGKKWRGQKLFRDLEPPRTQSIAF